LLGSSATAQSTRTASTYAPGTSAAATFPTYEIMMFIITCYILAFLLRTSRSCAVLLTWSAVNSRSKTLKSKRDVADLDGIKRSLYCTLERGENQEAVEGLPPPAAAAPAPGRVTPLMGDPTGVLG
jgi:hypothetical protein